MGDFDEFEEFEDEYDEDEFDTGEDAPVNNIPESFAKPKSMADIRSKLSGRPVSRRPSSPADEEDEYDEDGAGGAGAPAPSGAHKETDVNSPYSYIYDGDDEFGDAIETYAPAPSSVPREDPDEDAGTDYGYVPTAGLSEPSIAPIGAPDDADEDNPYDFDETLDIDPDEDDEDDFSAPPPPRALSYDFAGTDDADDTDPDDTDADESSLSSGSSGPMYDDKGLGKLANALVGLFMK